MLTKSGSLERWHAQIDGGVRGYRRRQRQWVKHRVDSSQAQRSSGGHTWVESKDEELKLVDEARLSSVNQGYWTDGKEKGRWVRRVGTESNRWCLVIDSVGQVGGRRIDIDGVAVLKLLGVETKGGSEIKGAYL